MTQLVLFSLGLEPKISCVILLEFIYPPTHVIINGKFMLSDVLHSLQIKVSCPILWPTLCKFQFFFVLQFLTSYLEMLIRNCCKIDIQKTANIVNMSVFFIKRNVLFMDGFRWHRVQKRSFAHGTMARDVNKLKGKQRTELQFLPRTFLNSWSCPSCLPLYAKDKNY